jgi:hypothetical protein
MQVLILAASYDNITTSIANAAIASTTLSPSGACCLVFAPSVSIQQWWTQSINVTVATVYTTYITYANTVVTKTRLCSNYSSSTTGYTTISLSGIPTSLINMGIYPAPYTFLNYDTEFTAANGEVITSPTPWYGTSFSCNDLKYIF